jgi:hypothetical protein
LRISVDFYESGDILTTDDNTVTREVQIMVILDTAMQEGHRCEMQAQDGIQQQRGTNKNIGVRNEHDIVLEVQCGWRAMWNEAFWFVLGMGVGPKCVILLHT